MKLVYVTSYTFPSKRAEPYYIQSMAEAFSEHMGEDFTLLIRGVIPDTMKHMRVLSVPIPDRLRIVRYFFSLPRVILKNSWNDSTTVFMSNDPYLLSVLIVLRKILRLRYKICSDWHQLFDDWRDVFVSKNSEYRIATSQRLRSLMSRACNIDESQILLAYGGIKPEPFIERARAGKTKLREQLGLPAEAFLVGYIGAFRSVGLEKGLDTMIKALPYLDETIHMVFVGGSLPHIAEYTAMAEAVGVRDRCIFVPKQPFENVISYELAMDVLAIPYPDKHHFRDYGFPMKVWEYMASGRPIIYSNLEIIAEILKERATPFTPDDPESLGNAIMAIYNDRVSAEKVSFKNTKDVFAYTWKTRVEQI